MGNNDFTQEDSHRTEAAAQVWVSDGNGTMRLGDLALGLESGDPTRWCMWDAKTGQRVIEGTVPHYGVPSPGGPL